MECGFEAFFHNLLNSLSHCGPANTCGGGGGFGFSRRGYSASACGGATAARGGGAAVAAGLRQLLVAMKNFFESPSSFSIAK